MSERVGKVGRNAARRRAPSGAKFTEPARSMVTPDLSDWLDDHARLTGASRAEVIRSGLEMARAAYELGGLPVADAGRYREIIKAAQRQAVAASVELARTAEALGLVAHAAAGEIADSGALKAA